MSRHRRDKKRRRRRGDLTDAEYIKGMADLTKQMILYACAGVEAIERLCKTMVMIDVDLCRDQAIALAAIVATPTRVALAQHPDAMASFTLTKNGKPIDVEKAEPFAACAGRLITAMAVRDFDRAIMLVETLSASHDELAKLLALLLYHAHVLSHLGPGGHDAATT